MTPVTREQYDNLYWHMKRLYPDYTNESRESHDCLQLISLVHDRPALIAGLADDGRRYYSADLTVLGRAHP